MNYKKNFFVKLMISFVKIVNNSIAYFTKFCEQPQLLGFFFPVKLTEFSLHWVFSEHMRKYQFLKNPQNPP